jgi:hypothetical protein
MNNGLEQNQDTKDKEVNFIELPPTNTRLKEDKNTIEIITTGNKVLKDYVLPSSSHGVIGKNQLDKSYNRIIKRIQDELPMAKNLFSKIIHNNIVEKTSDIIASTIARPNAILFGSIAAFVVTLSTYTIARTDGYSLSGFETILAFIIGWLLGITYDYLKILFAVNK